MRAVNLITGDLIFLYRGILPIKKVKRNVFYITAGDRGLRVVKRETTKNILNYGNN